MSINKLKKKKTQQEECEQLMEFKRPHCYPLRTEIHSRLTVTADIKSQSLAGAMLGNTGAMELILFSKTEPQMMLGGWQLSLL